MSPQHTTALALAAAFFCGLIIGIERGWRRRDDPEGTRVVGVRTIALIGLLGGVGGLLQPRAGAAPMAVGAASLTILLVLRTWQSLARSEDRGATTLVAALLAYFLGALATMGHPAAAAGAAVIAAWVMSLKPHLHTWLNRLERKELFAGLQLLLIAVVILPLLPDRGFGPYAALNPHKLWLFVVMVSGLSFAAYVAIKLLGPGRGMLFTAFAGGIVSSTAATVTFAHQAREAPDLVRPATAGILIASTVMALRILVLAAVVHRPLVWPLLPSMLAMAATSLALALLIVHGRMGGEGTIPSEAFNLSTGIQLALALALILVLSRGMHDWLGEAGLYLVSVAAGLSDVDAVTISTAELAAGGLAPGSAALAIVLAAVSNTALKAGLAGAIAGRRLAMPVWAGLGASMAAALAGWWLGAGLGGLIQAG